MKLSKYVFSFTEAELIYLDEAINFYLSHIGHVRDKVFNDTSLSSEQRKEELTILRHLCENYCKLNGKLNG